MAKHPRLHKRGNVYCARVAVPRDIQATFGKSEVWKSLKTRDRQEALHKLRTEIDPYFERLFEDHRREQARLAEPPLEELTEEQIHFIGDAYYRHLLEEDDEWREGCFETDTDDGRELSFEEYVDDIEALGDLNRLEFPRGIRSEFIKDEAREVLSWDNVDLRISETSPSWPKLYTAILKASIRANDAKRRRNAGDVVEIPPAKPISPSREQPRLSQVVTEWVREKTAEKGGWVQSTATMNRLWAQRFIELSGDRPVNTYTKDDARTFKQTLQCLPPNFTNDKRLSSLSMRDAAGEAQRLGVRPMSITNINKIIGFVSALFNFADANYNIPGNPFTGLKMRRSGKARDERDPFTLSELKAVFSAPLFTGCKSPRYHNSPGEVIPNDQGIYWVPLIGLFTGARSGEILQLRLEDVSRHQGVWHFKVTDEGEGQTVKNAGSVRNIPIHKTLVDLGFLAFVEHQRKLKHQRLFPEMPADDNGYYSTYYSRKFRNTLKALGLKHPKNAFHSFRHSFKDACLNSRIPGEFADVLGGWAGSGMRRYGTGLADLPILQEEMAKLTYRGLDLSHLRPFGVQPLDRRPHAPTPSA